MYSKRANQLQPEGAYTVLAHAQALEAKGKKILHLEIGQPDFPTPEFISAAGIQAIVEGKTKYTPPAGIPKFRELISEYAGKQRGLKIHPDSVVVSPGSKPGLLFSVLALIDPGDEVIYPDPGFPAYEAIIRIAGGVPVPIPLREENNFSFDLDVFESKFNQRTKLVIINSPSNPTGSVISREGLAYVANKVLEQDAWVLSDEIYSRLVYEKTQAHSIAELDGMQEHTIIVDGFSKTFSMTGWRLGYMIAPQPLAEKLELLATQATGCTATFTQFAGIEALSCSHDFIENMVAVYERRRDRIITLINSIPGMHTKEPQGAFYVFPNIKSCGLSSGEVAARLLEETGVAVLSGTDFGPGGEGYIRIVYSTSLEIIEEGMEKISRWFQAQLP